MGFWTTGSSPGLPAKYLVESAEFDCAKPFHIRATTGATFLWAPILPPQVLLSPYIGQGKYLRIVSRHILANEKIFNPRDWLAKRRMTAGPLTVENLFPEENAPPESRSSGI